MKLSTYLLCWKGRIAHDIKTAAEERAARAQSLRDEIAKDGKVTVKSRVISAVAWNLDAKAIRGKELFADA